MNQDWISKELKDIGTLVTGNTPPKKRKEYYSNGTIAFIKPGDIQNSEIKTFSEKISEKARQVARIVNEGSVLVTCIGELGRVGYVTNELAFNQQINAVMPANEVDGKFLFYRMLLEKKQLEKLASATTVAIVNKSKFGKVRITYPDSKEYQKQIVEALETQLTRVDVTIKTLTVLRDKLNLYRKSVLKAAFAGKIVSFKKPKEDNLRNFIEDIASGYACGKHSRSGKGLIHFRPYNITPKGEVSLDRIKIVAADFSDKRLRYGDVVFNNTNSQAWVGKTCYYDSDESVGFSNHMTRIRADKEKLDFRFLARQLHYFFEAGLYHKIMKNHVNQSSVNIDALKEVVIKVPSLDEQREVIACIDAKMSIMDNISKNIDGAILSVELLKKSILKSAFEGKLVKEGD